MRDESSSEMNSKSLTQPPKMSPGILGRGVGKGGAGEERGRGWRGNRRGNRKEEEWDSQNI